ncbi:MAG: FHA domain-containing protein [Solirubrobacteraceae bacterium]|nr:FHA domain-containing protein [Solirubrobacteraceae bacterium]
MLHCPECAFANAEGAKYCQKCGAFLGEPGEEDRESTAIYRVDLASGELVPVDLDDLLAEEGALLVVRGGGRAGESFALDAERLTVGRGQDSDILLDDVTVSRDHALLVRRNSQWFLDDLGSLNGTYVNRRRIDTQQLEDADELQIGKYKLTFLSR